MPDAGRGASDAGGVVNRSHARKLWLPKYPEVKHPCLSCPFVEGNDEHFAEVVSRLRELEGMPLVRASDTGALEEVRRRLRVETNLVGGDFLCHQTTYDEDMELTDRSSWRQCAGAARFYRGDG